MLAKNYFQSFILIFQRLWQDQSGSSPVSGSTRQQPVFRINQAAAHWQDQPGSTVSVERFGVSRMRDFKIDIVTLVPSVWKFVKAHYEPKNLNHCMGAFDSSNEEPGRTDCNEKNPQRFAIYQCWRKSWKTPHYVNFAKKTHFLRCFLIF